MYHIFEVPVERQHRGRCLSYSNPYCHFWKEERLASDDHHRFLKEVYQPGLVLLLLPSTQTMVGSIVRTN